MGRLEVVHMIARRLALRQRPAGPKIRRLVVWSAVAVVCSGLAIWLGTSSLSLVAVFGVAAMVLLVAVSLFFFPPAMAISVVGVALSCASLMTALAVTAGFQLAITRAMTRLNGHVLLTKYGLDFFEYERVRAVWMADPRVTAGSAFAYSMVAIVGGLGGGADRDDGAQGGDLPAPAGAALGPAVVVGKGLDPVAAADLDGLATMLGRGNLTGLRPGDTRHRPGIVLGTELAREIGTEVGEFVRVVVPAEIRGDTAPGLAAEPRHATFEVLDLLDTGTTEYDRNLALLHITAGQALFFGQGRVTGIEFQLTDPHLAREVAADMEAVLGRPYRVSTWEDSNSALLTGLRQIRVTLSVILGLMMVVASSSLLASLFLVVRRKHHDIGVLRAVGADRHLTFWVFESVGVFAGAVGAGFGLALGGLFCGVIDRYRFPLQGEVYPVDHLPVMIRSLDALGPAAVAIALCALASGPVAMIATRVGILDALRR